VIDIDIMAAPANIAEPIASRFRLNCRMSGAIIPKLATAEIRARAE